MQAMILAAGLGTRLWPLTSMIPKPLVPIGNIPVIDRLIRYLKQHGIRDIIMNAHHHHQQIITHIDGGRPFGINIDVSVEPEILGTGGGIKNTEDFWDGDPFFVVNGDILTDIDLGQAWEEHRRSKNLVTLILHDYEPFNQILIDKQKNILDIANKKGPGRFAFTGIHIIEPSVLRHIQRGIFSSIIDCYRNLIQSGEPIRAHVSSGHKWRDIGTVPSYILANKEALDKDHFILGPDCRIHNSVKLEDWAIIGKGVRLEENVEIKRSILWEGVMVKKGTRIIDSIVTSFKEIAGDLKDEIY